MRFDRALCTARAANKQKTLAILNQSLHPQNLPTAVSFDAAGTLFRPAAPVGATYAQAAAAHGIHVSADACSAAFGTLFANTPAPQYAAGAPSEEADRRWWKSLVAGVLDQAHGSPVPNMAQSAIFDDLFAHYARPEAWRLYPETRDVLGELTARGHPLAITSNFDARLHGVLQGLGLADCFGAVVISSQTGSSKPSPHIFQATLAALDVPPAACLHVGDSPEADVEGARACGLHTQLVDRPNNDLTAVLHHPRL